MCEPPSAIGTRLHQNTRRSDGATDAFATRLEDILNRALPMGPETRELQPRVLPLAGDARAMLVAYSDHVEAQQAPGGTLAHVKGYASKAAEQAARVAGVLTAWASLDACEVSAVTMADAITLAAFYLTEASRLSDAATISAEIERAEALRKWLLSNWEHPEILQAEIVRHAPIRALRESPAAQSAVKVLAKHGWLTALPQGQVIRGATRKQAWKIVGHSCEV